MKRILLIVLPFLIPSCSYAQYDFDSLYKNNDQFKEKIDIYARDYDIFSEDELLEITLTSDFRNLIRRKYRDEYQDATLEYFLNDTVIVKRKVKIKPRGNLRRRRLFLYRRPFRRKSDAAYPARPHGRSSAGRCLYHASS